MAKHIQRPLSLTALFVASSCALHAESKNGCLTSSDCLENFVCDEAMQKCEPRGPLARWKLDEGAGITTADASGRGNGGRLLNGAAWTTGRLGSAVLFDGVDD